MKIITKMYFTPRIRVVDTRAMRALCGSQTFSVDPTEVGPADREVVDGGDYDDLY